MYFVLLFFFQATILLRWIGLQTYISLLNFFVNWVVSWTNPNLFGCRFNSTQIMFGGHSFITMSLWMELFLKIQHSFFTNTSIYHLSNKLYIYVPATYACQLLINLKIWPNLTRPRSNWTDAFFWNLEILSSKSILGLWPIIFHVLLFTWWNSMS